MSTEKAFRGTEKKMKKTIPLLVLATVLGFAAIGCDAAPKDEPTTTPTAGETTSSKTAAPAATESKTQ